MNKEAFNSNSFLSMLTIAFIVLKLCNVIDWSWWWILSPFWICFIIGTLIALKEIADGSFKETEDDEHLDNE